MSAKQRQNLSAQAFIRVMCISDILSVGKQLTKLISNVEDSKRWNTILILFVLMHQCFYCMFFCVFSLENRIQVPILCVISTVSYVQVDENGKITRLRRECPNEECGAGVFMASHFDRQYCGKCCLTYVFNKPEDK